MAALTTPTSSTSWVRRPRRQGERSCEETEQGLERMAGVSRLAQTSVSAVTRSRFCAWFVHLVEAWMLLWLLKSERCCGWCPVRSDQSGGVTRHSGGCCFGDSLLGGGGLGPGSSHRPCEVGVMLPAPQKSRRRLRSAGPQPHADRGASQETRGGPAGLSVVRCGRPSFSRALTVKSCPTIILSWL